MAHVIEHDCFVIFLVSSMILAGAMGSRAVRSGKFMPAGLVATLR